MEFSESAITAAHAARSRVEHFARSVQVNQDSTRDEIAALRDVRSQFFGHLDDDFDTPGALAVLFSHIRRANKASVPPGAETWQFLKEVDSLFDAFDLSRREAVDSADADDSDVAQQIRHRTELRADRRYAEADAIRQSLLAKGIVLEDAPDGTRWWRADTR